MCDEKIIEREIFKPKPETIAVGPLETDKEDYEERIDQYGLDSLGSVGPVG